MTQKKGPSTELIHRGEDRVWQAASLTTPIYETTTFVFDSAEEVRLYQEGRSAKYIYSRYENPTVNATEEKVAALDHAEAALVFGSGMSATATTLLTFLGAGDELVCSAAAYGGTHHFAADVLPRFGINVRFASLDQLIDDDRLCGPATRLVWFESPTNPTLRCVDIARVADICRRHGALSVADNTFASPMNQQPLALGVDLAMQSATKYLNGHSDVTGGVLSGPKELIARVSRMRRQLGTILDPQAAYALARGLKTLAVRIERHNANAMAVASALAADPRVKTVHYPGLPSHPDHAVASRQMQGFGGMVCLDLAGGLACASRVFDRLGIIRRAASLGGVESLASLPVLTSHYGYSEDQLREAGVTDGMLRLSIGLEDAADLIADLDQALS